MERERLHSDGFDMERYKKELDSIIAPVIRGMNDLLAEE